MFNSFPPACLTLFPPACLTPFHPAPRPREQALASPDNIYPFAWALDGRRIGESSNSSFRSDSPSHFLVRRSGIPFNDLRTKTIEDVTIPYSNCSQSIKHSWVVSFSTHVPTTNGKSLTPLFRGGQQNNNMAKCKNAVSISSNFFSI